MSHELTREEAACLVEARSNRGRRKLTSVEVQRRITERQARLGLSQPGLKILINALGVPISQNEISKIETGERQRLSLAYVAALSKVLRMDEIAVIKGSPQPKIVRILGEMLGNEAVRLFEEEQHLSLNGWALEPGTVGFRVSTDAHPRYEEGEILLCHEAGADIESCIGRRCVAEFDGHRYVGRVERGASARVITLRPARDANPTLIDKTPIWISPIIGTIAPAS